MPIQFIIAAATVVAAGASVAGGIGAQRAGKFNAWQAEFAGRLEAFNIESERKLNVAQATQNHVDRLDLYKENLSANIATFAAAGRDIGGADRSVAAFLQRQQDVAAGDVARSDFMGQIQSNKMMAESASARSTGLQQAAAYRAQGTGQMVSSIANAFSTVAGGIYQYNAVRT